MFCPNCNVKLKDPNQRFCQNCGSEIPDISEAPKLSTEKSPYESTPDYTDYAVSQQKLAQMPAQKPAQMPVQKPAQIGGTGPHSIKCFVFAMISIGLVIFGWIFGLSSILRPLLTGPSPTATKMLIDTIIVTILNIAGLVFGIMSKVNSAKAGRLESKNGLKRVGSVFGLLGLIFNAISLVLVLLFLVFVTLMWMLAQSTITYY